ncbi:ATP-binding protein [Roseiterribacter gracilis]
MSDLTIAQRRQALLIWLFGFGVIASIWIAFASFLLLDRKQQIEEAHQSTGALASALAEQVDRTFADADRLLRFLRSEMQLRPNVNPFIRARELGLITDAYTQAVVVDEHATGRAFLVPPPESLPRMFADREWVRVTEAMTEDAVFVDKPIRGRVQGRWAINIARPILENGIHKGAVVVALDPFGFARFFDRINLGPGGSAQIFDRFGQLLSRSRLTDEMLEGKRRLLVLPEMIAQDETGYVETRSPIDGLQKLISVQRLASFPLGVSVGYSRDDVLAPVWLRAKYLGASGAILTLLCLMATAGLYAGHKRRATLVTALAAETERLGVIENRLRDVIETMQDGVAVWDGDGRLVLANSPYRAFFDPIGHLLQPGLNWRAWRQFVLGSGLLEADASSGEEWWKLPPSERKEVRAEIRLTSGVWLLCREAATSDGGVLGLRTDITELKLRELELSDSHAELQAKSDELGMLVREIETAKWQVDRAYEARGLLLTHISHELRTPMTAVIGFAKLIQARTFGPLGDERYGDFVDRIVANGEHQVAIINDVLDLARAEAGRLTLTDDTVSLDALVGWVLPQMQPLADAAKIILQQGQVDPVQVRGDEKRLRQALLNLIANAIKFSPAGLITVDALRLESGEVMIRVTDTGRGIDPADLARVMELFGQAGGPSETVGTGVGLPLVRRLIEAHGGRFELASDGVGAGTVARLYLPASRLADASAERPDSELDRRAQTDRRRGVR